MTVPSPHPAKKRDPVDVILPETSRTTALLNPKTEPEEYVRYWRRNVPSRRTNWLDVRHNVIVSNLRSSPKSPTYILDGDVRMLMSNVSPSCGKASPVQFDATFM